MKKAAIALVLTVIAFAATTAFAQARFTLRADVPFGFSVDGQHYPAGPYELRTLNGYTVQLLNVKTGDASMVKLINHDQVKSEWNNAAPMLRFAVSGKRAYLISLTDAQENTWKVPVAARDLEATRKPESNVVVALK